MGTFYDFRLKSPSISETGRDRPIVTMEVNRKSYALYRVMTIFNDLEDP